MKMSGEPLVQASGTTMILSLGDVVESMERNGGAQEMRLLIRHIVKGT